MELQTKCRHLINYENDNLPGLYHTNFLVISKEEHKQPAIIVKRRRNDHINVNFVLHLQENVKNCILLKFAVYLTMQFDPQMNSEI